MMIFMKKDLIFAETATCFLEALEMPAGATYRSGPLHYQPPVPKRNGDID